MDIKLVIFDLDGVLVDACNWHRAALNSALIKISNTEIKPEEHYSTFNGIPTKKKLQILVEQGRVKKEDQEKIFHEKQKSTIEIIEKSALVRKEKIDLINKLKSKHIKAACFTNSIRETANLMLEKTGVLSLFDKILTNQDVESPKPDPEGYIRIMEYFNCDPINTMIVEDSPKGMQAARASKANVIMVKNPDQVNLSLMEQIL
jgi:beta-phosphoglucomutase